MDNIIVITNPAELSELADALTEAWTDGRKVRIAIGGGVKIAVGGGMWSRPFGSPTDATGQVAI